MDDMKYMEITVKLDRCAIEAALAALDMIGIDDAEVRDPHDAEEIMADKETYEWDYVDEKVAENIGKQPELHIYHEINGASDKASCAAASGEASDPAASGDGLSEEDTAFLTSVQNAMKKVQKDFADGLYGEGLDSIRIETEYEVKDDSLWKDKWKEYFKPSHISNKIVVKPTWENYEAKDGEIVIEIDPGMAFGTGTHETTSMCVKALEKYVEPGMTVLDAGCGSGILSIAAAKLGASDVLGVDIDEEAVRVSGENFALNGTDDVCKAVVGDVTKGVEYPSGDKAAGERYQADIVAANLMAELLCMISEGLASHMKSGGKLISSGILVEKEEMVGRAFRGAGLEVTETMYDGEWCCIIAEK